MVHTSPEEAYRKVTTRERSMSFIATSFVEFQGLIVRQPAFRPTGLAKSKVHRTVECHHREVVELAVFL